VPQGHRLYIDCTIFGQGRNLEKTPAAIFLGAENSPSTNTLNFLSERKEAISLMRLLENSDSDHLHSRPERHEENLKLKVAPVYN
jgi:hypothetical protein